MKRSPRGSSVTRTLREEMVARVLEGTGPHICIPWTGADWTNTHVCQGLVYTPARGLLCYVVPQVIARELRLFPGFLGTKQLQPPPAGSEEAKERGRTEEQQVVALGQERAKEQYLRLLQRWTRLVKITGYPETEIRFHPRNEDYQIVVLGAYLQAQVGTLLSQPDLYSSGKFLVTLGTDPVRAAAADNVPRDSTGELKPGARAVALVKEFQAESVGNRIGAGVPVRGEAPRARVAVDAPLKVYTAPSGAPPTKSDLDKVVAVDPSAPAPAAAVGR